ncbi:MAG: GerMN domain-containing protein [Ginsengibacter sp.]
MYKIKLICTWIVIVTFCSCNSSEDKKAVVVEETITDTVSSTSLSSDSAQTVINRSLIWTVDEAKPGKEKLKKPETAIPETFSSAQLIEVLNNNFPEIHLNLVKISNDTIYVDIPDSKKLSTGIGDTGAENYMASATYTLTELKNVKFVNFKFPPGDHAEPGTYSRNDFERLR